MIFKRNVILEEIPSWSEPLLYLFGINILALISDISGLLDILWSGIRSQEKIDLEYTDYLALTLIVAVFMLFKSNKIEEVVVADKFKIIYMSFLFKKTECISPLDEINYSFKRKYIPQKRRGGNVLEIRIKKRKFIIRSGVDGWSGSMIDEIYAELELLSKKKVKVYE